jgi:hypothetical protein
MAVGFSDGVRSLRYDDAAVIAKIGRQSIGDVPTSITAIPDDSAIPSGDSAQARATLYLAAYGEVAAGGNLDVVGTNWAEHVELLGGTVTLDGSFNRGGDTLQLNRDDSDFTGHVSGSQFVIQSNVGTPLLVNIPVGTDGMDVIFDGAVRSLVYDPGALQLLLGSQIIATEGNTVLG